MASIGDLVISLRADIASFRSGMNEANQQLDTLKQHSSDAAQALQSLQRYFETVISVATIQRIADFGASLVEGAAKVGHLSEALGISAEKYQGLAYAAKEAGVPADAFASSMDRLQKNLEMLGTGATSPAQVFAQLGLSAKNADGSIRSVASTLDDLAHNKIFLAESAAQQLGQVMTITGARSADAANMVNMLTGKIGDLRQAQLDAIASGQALSEETIKGAEKMETDLTAIWTRLKNTFVSGVVMAYQHPMASLAGAWTPEQARGLPSWLGGYTPASEDQGQKSPPPGPAVVDPTKAKQLESFTDEYKKLVETFQEDADYQTKLRAAYQENAGAVAQVSAAHAADAAQLRLLETAQRDHVTATQAEIAAVRSAASAAELAAKAAQEQKTVTDAMAAAQKTYDDAVLKVMDETDGLTEKQQKLADMLGILEQKLLSGAIDWDEYAARAKAAEQLITSGGADKGMAEFARGLSSDLDSLIGKLTDVSARKKGESIFAQFRKDTDEFTASIEKLLLKLVVINPLLNSLGLGGDKGLPTAWGSSGAGGVTGGGGAGAGFSLIGMLGGLGKLLGFQHGGEFVVGGMGGTDSQLVAFKATPGERVSVGDRNDARRSGPGDINIIQNISGVHSDSFRANRHQITGDAVRAIKAGAGRYA